MNPNEIKRQFSQALQVLEQENKLDKVTVCRVSTNEAPDAITVTVTLPTKAATVGAAPGKKH